MVRCGPMAPRCGPVFLFHFAHPVEACNHGPVWSYDPWCGPVCLLHFAVPAEANIGWSVSTVGLAYGLSSVLSTVPVGVGNGLRWFQLFRFVQLPRYFCHV